jgi:large subunit ribosomal protein L6e
MGRQRHPKPCANAKRPNLKPLNRYRPKDRQTRLRKSMVPGRVGVVLIGPYTSKKVVFLKQLESGLLLCACMNNGAVRRFPQKWLLTTQTTNKLNKNIDKTEDNIVSLVEQIKYLRITFAKYNSYSG